MKACPADTAPPFQPHAIGLFVNWPKSCISTLQQRAPGTGRPTRPKRDQDRRRTMPTPIRCEVRNWHPSVMPEAVGGVATAIQPTQGSAASGGADSYTQASGPNGYGTGRATEAAGATEAEMASEAAAAQKATYADAVKVGMVPTPAQM